MATQIEKVFPEISSIEPSTGKTLGRVLQASAEDYDAAVNEASRKVDEEMSSTMGAMTGGMKIPGMF